MALYTTSAIISFYDRLEETAIRFYEVLADKHSEGRNIFLDLAKEHRAERETLLRAYREAITDVAEVGFSFAGMHEHSYTIEPKLDENLSFSQSVTKALEIEERICQFCVDVGEKSKGLLTDISQAFLRSAGIKAENKRRLERLLEKNPASKGNYFLASSSYSSAWGS